MLRRVDAVCFRGRVRSVAARLSRSTSPRRATPTSCWRGCARWGWRGSTRCRLTRNRDVMVSFGGGELRVHEGYLGAPLDVLRAIVTFVERPDARRAAGGAARHPLAPDPRAAAARRAPRAHRTPDDAPIAEKLAEWHAPVQRPALSTAGCRHVPIRVSRRMKSRLGHYTAATAGGRAGRDRRSAAPHLAGTGGRRRCTRCCTRWCTSGRTRRATRSTTAATFRAKAREVGHRAVRATRAGHAVRDAREGSQTLGRRAARDG